MRTLGVGVDALPLVIRNSSILTGNDLGRLGNVEVLPDRLTIEELKECPEVREILEAKAERSTTLIRLHNLAKEHLKLGNTNRALGILMTIR